MTDQLSRQSRDSEVNHMIQLTAIIRAKCHRSNFGISELLLHQRLHGTNLAQLTSGITLDTGPGRSFSDKRLPRKAMRSLQSLSSQAPADAGCGRRLLDRAEDIPPPGHRRRSPQRQRLTSEPGGGLSGATVRQVPSDDLHRNWEPQRGDAFADERSIASQTVTSFRWQFLVS